MRVSLLNFFYLRLLNTSKQALKDFTLFLVLLAKLSQFNNLNEMRIWISGAKNFNSKVELRNDDH